LTTAGLIGSASHADAALYYWQDNDPGFYRRSNRCRSAAIAHAAASTRKRLPPKGHRRQPVGR